MFRSAVWPYSCESLVSLQTAASFLKKRSGIFLDLEPNRILMFKQAVVCVLRNVARVNAVRILNLTLAVIRPGVITNNRKGKNGSRYTHKKGCKFFKLPGFLPDGQVGLPYSFRKTLRSCARPATCLGDPISSCTRGGA